MNQFKKAKQMALKSGKPVENIADLKTAGIPADDKVKENKTTTKNTDNAVAQPVDSEDAKKVLKEEAEKAIPANAQTTNMVNHSHEDIKENIDDSKVTPSENSVSKEISLALQNPPEHTMASPTQISDEKNDNRIDIEAAVDHVIPQAMEVTQQMPLVQANNASKSVQVLHENIYDLTENNMQSNQIYHDELEKMAPVQILSQYYETDEPAKDPQSVTAPFPNYTSTGSTQSVFEGVNTVTAAPPVPEVQVIPEPQHLPYTAEKSYGTSASATAYPPNAEIQPTETPTQEYVPYETQTPDQTSTSIPTNANIAYTPMQSNIPQVNIMSTQAVNMIKEQPTVSAYTQTVDNPASVRIVLPTTQPQKQQSSTRKSIPNIFAPKDEAKSMRKSLVLKPTSVRKAENYCAKNGGSFNELIQTLLDNFIDEYGL